MCCSGRIEDGTRLVGKNGLEFANVMDMFMTGDYAYATIGLGQGFQACLFRLDRCESGDEAFHSRAIAVGSTKRGFLFGPQDQDLEFLPAVSAPVFIDRHRFRSPYNQITTGRAGGMWKAPGRGRL